MNITDFQVTPISQVYRAVCRLALRHKSAPVEGEVIGLIPEAACERESEWMRQLMGSIPRPRFWSGGSSSAGLAWRGIEQVRGIIEYPGDSKVCSGDSRHCAAV